MVAANSIQILDHRGNVIPIAGRDGKLVRVRVQHVEVGGGHLAVELAHQAVENKHRLKRKTGMCFHGQCGEHAQIQQTFRIAAIGRVRGQVGCVQKCPDVVAGEGRQSESPTRKAKRAGAVRSRRVLVAFRRTDLPEDERLHGQHIRIGKGAQLPFQGLYALDNLADALVGGTRISSCEA